MFFSSFYSVDVCNIYVASVLRPSINRDSMLTGGKVCLLGFPPTFLCWSTSKCIPAALILLAKVLKKTNLKKLDLRLKGEFGFEVTQVSYFLTSIKCFVFVVLFDIVITMSICITLLICVGVTQLLYILTSPSFHTS